MAIRNTPWRRWWRELWRKLRRLRLWFWRKLLNRKTLILILSVGMYVYRMFRWIKGVLELLE